MAEKMDNSLDNSNIQVEGEIGGSPQKIHKAPHASRTKAMAQGNNDNSLFERQHNNFIEGLE